MRRVLGVLAGLAGLLIVTGPAGAAAQPSEQDTAWMVAAHQSNLAEIAAGNAAVQRATTADVRRLGQMFIDMHTALDADLTAAAGELAVTLPAAPTPDQQATLERVQAEQGQAFDAAWIAAQIASHQATLQATRTEVEQGSNPTVVQLATASTPVVEQHLQELQSLSANAGAPTGVPTGDGGLLADTDSDSRSWMWLGAAGLGLVALGATAFGARALRHD